MAFIYGSESSEIESRIFVNSMELVKETKILTLQTVDPDDVKIGLYLQSFIKTFM